MDVIGAAATVRLRTSFDAAVRNECVVRSCCPVRCDPVTSNTLCPASRRKGDALCLRTGESFFLDGSASALPDVPTCGFRA